MRACSSARRTSFAAKALSAAALVALAVFALLVPAGPAAGAPARAQVAQTPDAPADVVMMAAPEKLTLAPGDEASVVVTISNPLTVPATVDGIDLIVPPRVTATLDGGGERFIVEAGARVTRRVQLTVGKDAPPGTLLLLADVTAPAPADSGLTAERYLAAAVDLSGQERADDLTVTIVSAPTEVSDGQSDAELAILVHNATGFEVKGIELRPIPSMDVHLVPSAGDGACPAKAASAGVITCLDALGPGRAEVVTMALKVDHRVRTGTQKIGVTASAHLDAPGAELVTTTSVTTEVKLSVFGVDALGPLGSTTLFVLPGILAILTFVTFGRLAYPRTSWIPAKVDVTDTKLALLALPVATVVYLLVWWLWGADLTREMSTPDVVLLFVLGVALGFGVWLAFATTYHRAIGRRQFKVGDSPKRVLERLNSGHGSLTCPTVSAIPGTGRLLGPGLAGKVAACSPITFRYTEAAQDDQAARNKFVADIERDDIAAVVRNVGPLVTLYWRAGGVRYFDPAEVTTGAAARLLEEAT